MTKIFKFNFTFKLTHFSILIRLPILLLFLICAWFTHQHCQIKRKHTHTQIAWILQNLNVTPHTKNFTTELNDMWNSVYGLVTRVIETMRKKKAKPKQLAKVPPKRMKSRYNQLTYLYINLNKENFQEFLLKCKLFLSTQNKVILNGNRKDKQKRYSAIFQEIAVLMVQTEYKFFKKKEKSAPTN